jgi:hypothetical protein
VTAEARAEEEKRSGEAPPKRPDDLPSPFDPRFRDRYEFSAGAAEDGAASLSFHPRSFDGALSGRSATGRGPPPRRLHLAKRPRSPAARSR